MEVGLYLKERLVLILSPYTSIHYKGIQIWDLLYLT